MRWEEDPGFTVTQELGDALGKCWLCPLHREAEQDAYRKVTAESDNLGLEFRAG